MRKEIKTGLFAVIVVAVALFMIEFLKGKDIFSRNNTFYIIYPSVEGLSVSTQITAGGYPAGIVSDIAYNPGAGDYTLTASIPRQFDIPADSYVEVYSADILGTKKLRIVRGTSPDAATAGDTLPGRTEPDMLGSLLGSLQPAASGLDSLLPCAACLAVGAFCGSLAGARLARRIPSSHLRKYFSVVLFVMAVLVLLQTGGVI